LNEPQNKTGRIVRYPTKVIVGGSTVFDGQMTNLSAQWAIVMLQRQLPHGQLCILDFGLMIDGRKQPLKVKSRISFSVCTGIDGFRVWFQFLELDNNTRNTLTEFTR
jgi:hypothetical protein